MPVQKQRSTKSRRNNARAHKKLTLASIIKCSQCGKFKLPHTICSNCGYYRGNMVVDVLKNTKKDARSEMKKEGPKGNNPNVLGKDKKVSEVKKNNVTLAKSKRSESTKKV